MDVREVDTRLPKRRCEGDICGVQPNYRAAMGPKCFRDAKWQLDEHWYCSWHAGRIVLAKAYAKADNNL